MRAAEKYCSTGAAYFLKDGRLKFRSAIQTNRIGSHVYVAGKFEIVVIDRWEFPHTQWIHKIDSDLADHSSKQNAFGS